MILARSLWWGYMRSASAMLCSRKRRVISCARRWLWAHQLQHGAGAFQAGLEQPALHQRHPQVAQRQDPARATNRQLREVLARQGDDLEGLLGSSTATTSTRACSAPAMRSRSSRASP